MIDPSLRAMMTQTIHFALQTGKTTHGDPVYGPATNAVRARVEPRFEVVRTSPDGEDVTTSHQLFTVAKLPESCKVWVLDADPNNPEHGRILRSIAPFYDENGNLSHYEALI